MTQKQMSVYLRYCKQ